MASRGYLAFLLSLSVSILGVSCRKANAYVGLDSSTLMRLARSYNPNKQTAQLPPAAKPAESRKTAIGNLPTELEYASTVKQALIQGNFEQLEKIVSEARTGKGRIVGGTWKLAVFYSAVDETLVRPDSQESDWKVFFNTLNQWIAAKPESAAARISLAEAYMTYAWRARGNGYANSVSDRGWDLFNERVSQAADALAQAARLKEKCPYWYESMQAVALAQGWDKTQARELMDEAVAFEPDYYHFYREHANYLQTKWYGDEGEVEAFATEVADRVGGAQGDILYFEITSLVACQCDAQDDAMKEMSWPRIKQGYAGLSQLYGISSLKRNRFASMAVKAGDREAARTALGDIGGDWDKEVWVSADRFLSAKNWASSE